MKRKTPDVRPYPADPQIARWLADGDCLPELVQALLERIAADLGLGPPSPTAPPPGPTAPPEDQ